MAEGTPEKKLRNDNIVIRYMELKKTMKTNFMPILISEFGISSQAIDAILKRRGIKRKNV